MSVIIKGVDMPENCYYCPACAGEYGICQADNEHRYVPDAGIRPDWCPLRPAPGWISVERLPETQGRYLVRTITGAVGVAFHPTDGGFVGYVRITHWMPLPEPPDGGDGDV